MAGVKWVKLTTDMFDNRKIRHLRRLPDGNNIVLIWVMLLTMAGRCNANGMIFLTENIPYTAKMLADELNFEENTVQLALKALEQLNMIVIDSGYFTIAGWEEYQNIEGMDKIREQTRKRVARHRQNRLLPDNNVTCNVTVTQSNATEEDIEEEIETDTDIEDKKKPSRKKTGKVKDEKSYSDNPELNQAILSFIEFRKSIKKPMTERAVELLMNKLSGMSDSIQEQIEIINQSIMNGWQGVFPLKENTQPKYRGNKRTEVVPGWMKSSGGDDLDRAERMLGKTAGNDPDLAARAEALKQSFSL